MTGLFLDDNFFIFSLLPFVDVFSFNTTEQIILNYFLLSDMGFANVIVGSHFSQKHTNFIWQQKQMQLGMWMCDQIWGSKDKHYVADEIQPMLSGQYNKNAACVAQEIQEWDHQLAK